MDVVTIFIHFHSYIHSFGLSLCTTLDPEKEFNHLTASVAGCCATTHFFYAVDRIFYRVPHYPFFVVSRDEKRDMQKIFLIVRPTEDSTWFEYQAANKILARKPFV
jgi:hypothetical protein